MHKWDRFRLRSLEFLAHWAMALAPDSHLFSLQQGPGREELLRRSGGPSVIEPPLDSETVPRPFAETAAILSCLDSVVTVDTAVGHLAGAIGVPTRVLLGRMTDWRWLVERSDSPWYESVRLERLGAVGEP